MQKRLFKRASKKPILQNHLKNHIVASKAPSKGFFIADMFDAVSFRDDLKNMGLPLFALKAGDTKDRHYEVSGLKIAIKSNSAGIATIHDKDI